MCRNVQIKLLLALLFLITGIRGSAQEICDNGKDDDGDGRVDLKDPDCACNFRVTGNLLRNGSFEAFKHCPEYSYERDSGIADFWEYGTYTNNNETNYYHTLPCSYDWSQVALYQPPAMPLPDGKAFVSIRQYVPRKRQLKETDIAKTYVGQCLQSPLKPGEKYTLTFNSGRFKSNDDRDFKYRAEPFTVAVFGHADCNAVPFGAINAQSSGCPTNYQGWTLLGKTTVHSKGKWVQNRIDFTVPSDINVIEIGPDCSILEADIDLADSTTFLDFYVYYLDDLHLLPTKDFHFANIQAQIGNRCEIDSELIAPVITNASYQWYKDSVAILGATAGVYHLPAGNRTGNYNVRITNADTCFISEPLTIGLNSLAGLKLPNDTTICIGDSTLLAPALTGVSYLYNGNRSFYVKVNKAGIYNIEAVDASGCRRTFKITVFTEDCAQTNLFMPNAFTPNADGKNDVFRVPSGEKVNVTAFSIFNRWGNKVFSTTNRSRGWDGTLHGKACAAGTYVYFITGIVNNQQKEFRGTFVLIR